MKRLFLAIPLVALVAFPALADYSGRQITDPPPIVVESPLVRFPPAGSPPRKDAEPPVPPVQAQPLPTDQPLDPQLPVPEVRWFPRGIGMPLVPDDPDLTEKRVAMLTFDDGPSSFGTTDQILDTLKAHQVRAVFFITGYGARNRDLVERIHREGHILAPHSMTHANLSRLSKQMMREEIEPLIKLIQEVTGSPPKYFRPPFGMYNETLLELLAEYEMELINWTNGSLDWEGLDGTGHKDPALVVATVMEQLHRGAVILLHDTLPHTAEALPEIIRQVRGDGYEFVILP